MQYCDIITCLEIYLFKVHEHWVTSYMNWISHARLFVQESRLLKWSRLRLESTDRTDYRPSMSVLPAFLYLTHSITFFQLPLQEQIKDRYRIMQEQWMFLKTFFDVSEIYCFSAYWLRSKCLVRYQHSDLWSPMRALSLNPIHCWLVRFCVLSLHREVDRVWQYTR